MSWDEFDTLLSEIADHLEQRGLNEDMAVFLNDGYPCDGSEFACLTDLCADGEREGWLMKQDADGIESGRVIKPGKTGRFSVDVERIKDVKGTPHSHSWGNRHYHAHFGHTRVL